MRLNFSGVDEDAIREGVRRIGEVVREQVAMYGTLTGARAARPAQAAAPPRQEAPARADVTAAAARIASERERRGGEELAKVLPMPVSHKRAG
jgi:2-aminoadipate transaminase